MEIVWTHKAQQDLERISYFLVAIDQKLANRTLKSILSAPDRLIEHPNLGEKVEMSFPKEVRRLLVGSYEMRYTVSDAIIYILRPWHTREDRV